MPTRGQDQTFGCRPNPRDRQSLIDVSSAVYALPDNSIYHPDYTEYDHLAAEAAAAEQAADQLNLITNYIPVDTEDEGSSMDSYDGPLLVQEDDTPEIEAGPDFSVFSECA